MFSLIQKISRLYALVLLLLLAIVTMTSVTIVSMVHNHYAYSDTLRLIQTQRNLAQSILINLPRYTLDRDTLTSREKLNRFLLLKNDLQALKETYTDFIHLSENEERTLPEALNAAISRQWSGETLGAYTGELITRMDAMLGVIKQYIAENNVDIAANEHFRDLEAYLYGLGLKRLTLAYNDIQDLADDDFQWHKNMLLLCIVLFIALIAMEASIIYRPFSKRLQAKIIALEKEQNIITQTAAAIKEEEERISLAMQGVDMGIFDWHIPEDHLHLSSAAYKVLNLERSNPDAHASDIHTLNVLKKQCDPRDRSRFDMMLEQHLELGRKFSLDIRIPDDDANEGSKWINIKGQAEWNELGTATRFVGVMRDITEQKQLEDLKHMFMTGIESSHLPMAIIDVAQFGRQFLYVSPGLCHLLGYDKDHLLKSNMYMLNGPDTKLEDIDRVENIFESGDPASLNIIHYKSDGNPFLDEMEMTPIKGQDDRIIAYVTFHNDISEAEERNEKEVERQRSEAAGHLAQLVAGEAVSLINELQEEALDDAARDKTDRLKTLHEGILGFFSHSKTSSDSFLIKDEINDIAKTNKSFYSKDIKWDIHISATESENEAAAAAVAHNETDFIAYIDKAELRQALFNIIKNAVYAYENNFAHARIKIEGRFNKLSVVDARNIGLPPQTQTYLVLTISDYGIGIEKELQERIFTPLYSHWRTENTSGMGLTVAQALLKSWGGQITIDSQPENGTKVTLFIPVYESKEDKDFMEMSVLLDELNTGTQSLH